VGRLEVDGTALTSDKRHARCERGEQGIGHGGEVRRDEILGKSAMVEVWDVESSRVKFRGVLASWLACEC